MPRGGGGGVWRTFASRHVSSYYQKKSSSILTGIHNESAKFHLVKLAAACGASLCPTHKNKIISCG